MHNFVFFFLLRVLFKVLQYNCSFSLFLEFSSYAVYVNLFSFLHHRLHSTSLGHYLLFHFLSYRHLLWLPLWIIFWWFSILQNRCDVNSQSYSGNTALHSACGRGQVETVRLLLKSGADSSLKNYHNDTPVMVAKNKKVSEAMTKRKNNKYNGHCCNSIDTVLFLLFCFMVVCSCFLCWKTINLLKVTDLTVNQFLIFVQIFSLSLWFYYGNSQLCVT